MKFNSLTSTIDGLFTPTQLSVYQKRLYDVFTVYSQSQLFKIRIPQRLFASLKNNDISALQLNHFQLLL